MHISNRKVFTRNKIYFITNNSAAAAGANSFWPIVQCSERNTSLYHWIPLIPTLATFEKNPKNVNLSGQFITEIELKYIQKTLNFKSNIISSSLFILRCHDFGTNHLKSSNMDIVPTCHQLSTTNNPNINILQ